ncbi:flavin reductase family protein [Streptomyces himastatinicus]|uniref:flavin reductase family protein n=1 Tax=Streptomyces himastatinicus TaxID=998084 RepID=UPI003CCB1BA6
MSSAAPRPIPRCTGGATWASASWPPTSWTSKVFASKGEDKFAQVSWTPGDFGAPLIDGSCAQLEVEIGERLEAGSHTVFTGRVVSARCDDLAPLVYSGGGFFDISHTAPLPW